MDKHFRKLVVTIFVGTMILMGGAYNSAVGQGCVAKDSLYNFLTGRVLVSNDCQRSCATMVQHGCVLEGNEITSVECYQGCINARRHCERRTSTKCSVRSDICRTEDLVLGVKCLEPFK